MLRPLTPDDLPELTAIYRDAVLSQASALYSPAQIRAWAGHAAQGACLDAVLRRGFGLASCDADNSIAAFAVLEPADRLALLYCRGRCGRQGHGRRLVQALEAQARQQGCGRLRTEASQLSRPLLERLGWQVEAEETVLFAGEWFRRWRMIRCLAPRPEPEPDAGRCSRSAAPRSDSPADV